MPDQAMPYCRAYRLGELRASAAWRECADDAAAGLADTAVVYLRDDFTVVRDPVGADPRPLLTAPTESWRTYCRDTLGFAVPSDLRQAEPR